MKKKILIVDNDLDFLDSRAEALDKAGYQVYKSTSLDQAESFLANNWVHVAVIDVRMRDDSDDRDTSGLSLAKKELYRSIPKIILTRYPSYIAVREALGPAVEGLPPAVAYVSKKDGAKAMIEAIEEALATFTKIKLEPRYSMGYPRTTFVSAPGEPVRAATIKRYFDLSYRRIGRPCS